MSIKPCNFDYDVILYFSQNSNQEMMTIMKCVTHRNKLWKFLQNTDLLSFSFRSFFHLLSLLLQQSFCYCLFIVILNLLVSIGSSVITIQTKQQSSEIFSTYTSFFSGEGGGHNTTTGNENRLSIFLVTRLVTVNWGWSVHMVNSWR